MESEGGIFSVFPSCLRQINAPLPHFSSFPIRSLDFPLDAQLMSKALESTTSCLSLAIDPGIRSHSLGRSECSGTGKIHQGQKEELLGREQGQHGREDCK